jgi:hypothetical protein
MGVTVILPVMILVSSLALCLFYLQAICHNILRREFDPERLRSIANAYRLEFLFVRKEMEQATAPVDYKWVRMALKCDYLALTYLLKNAAAAGCSRKERLLMLYFKTLLMVLSVSHLLKLDEKGAILKQTSILHYFANTLGEQVGPVQFCSLTA